MKPTPTPCLGPSGCRDRPHVGALHRGETSDSRSGSALDNRDPTFPPLPPWAARARLAHANAVENLVVFAPLCSLRT